MSGKYIVGIDLGTTNSCVAYLDRSSPHKAIEQLSIPQLVAAGKVERRPLLPSYCYLLGVDELPSAATALPWHDEGRWLVGCWAAELGGKVPGRLVSAAKSWLCHSLVGRRDPLLPLLGEASVRISPLEATRRYLRHIAAAWNWAMAGNDPEAEISQQTVVITVPASFDEVARRLTAEAARAAGFEAFTLVEEPLAAFYNWLDVNREQYDTLLRPGDRVLVFDVGGGTCDFSLIAVQGDAGRLTFQREAVGDHLLLGGENIDAAIAAYIGAKLPGGVDALTPTQWHQLCHSCRAAKEALLSSDDERASAKVTVLGGGAGLVAGTRSCELIREELCCLLKDGFFAMAPWQEAVLLRRGTGIRTVGLPYERETSFIKQMAGFLERHGAADNAPTKLLFNGGTMRPTFFRQAVLQALRCWFPATASQELSTKQYDAAVARGAVAYARAGEGADEVRVSCGSARSYYVAFEGRGAAATPKALTVLPRGAEAGRSYSLAHTFHLRANTPVAFQIYSSHTRLGDALGDVVDIDELSLTPLPPVQTVLSYGKGASQSIEALIPASLQLSLTPLGILEIQLLSKQSQHRWTLEFQLGAAPSAAAPPSQRGDVTFAEGFYDEARSAIASAFSKGGGLAPGRLVEALEQAIGLPRQQWPPSALRALWPSLFSHAEGRWLSADHRLRWWWLAGFALRPGVGYPLDEQRLKEWWRVVLAEKQKPLKDDQLAQLLVCCRRVAAGLSKGQQTLLASELMPSLMAKNRLIEVPRSGSALNLYQEKIRALASFERLEVSAKAALGEALLARIVAGTALPCEYWALGRLASRHLLAASLSHVLPAALCGRWLETLIDHRRRHGDSRVTPLFDPMARMTGLPEVDLPLALRQQILSLCVGDDLLPSLERHLTTVVPYDHAELESCFGEALPLGLLLEVN